MTSEERHQRRMAYQNAQTMHRAFHELIADFDLKTLARRQAKALKTAGVPEAG